MSGISCSIPGQVGRCWAKVSLEVGLDPSLAKFGRSPAQSLVEIGPTQISVEVGLNLADSGPTRPVTWSNLSTIWAEFERFRPHVGVGPSCAANIGLHIPRICMGPRSATRVEQPQPLQRRAMHMPQTCGNPCPTRHGGVKRRDSRARACQEQRVRRQREEGGDVARLNI